MKEDGDSIVIGGIDFDERDMLMETQGDVFYITDHYRKFPFVLVRLSALTKTVLKEMLVGRAAQLAAMPVKKARGAAKKTKKLTKR